MQRGTRRLPANLAVLVLAVLIMPGCSLLGNNLFSPSPKASTGSEQAEEQNPLKLELDQETTDGERLFVKGRVKAETSVLMSKIVIHLSSLKNGELIGEAYYSMSSAQQDSGIQGMIPAGGEVPFSMSVSAEGMTDYQLELLWGEEAVSFLSALASGVQPPAPEVVLEEVTLMPPDCSGRGCAGRSFMSAVIRNQTDKALDSIVIGLGFSGAEEDQMEITSIGLEPHGTRPLRLEIDLPYDKAVSLDPRMRVINPVFTASP